MEETYGGEYRLTETTTRDTGNSVNSSETVRNEHLDSMIGH